jgi:GalNAc-alpha-(1->4)-GalNAc-alpha-(1->3)-diNAcBac-PP-undecaprenol alpha-1,4-N-acetyl-D-galactosaminyltransferase
MKNRKLTFVINALGPGGAERVMTFLAAAFATQGAQVSILSFDGCSPPFFPLPPAVAHRPLGLLGRSSGSLEAMMKNLHRIYRLRYAIRASRPDTVLSFCDQTNVLTILAAIGLGIRVVVAERSNPYLNTPPVWRFLRRLVYPLAHRVVVQTKEATRAFTYHSRVSVIPNPVSIPQIGEVSPDKRLKRPCVLGLGRLVPEKRFDLLIDAFAAATETHPGWSLVLVGVGPARADLESRIKERGIIGSVRLLGCVQRSEDLLSQADLFVLCSDYEGFPNALCEAMACGVAVIATDCPNGPREIIRDGVDGVLVPPSDAAALSAAMARLMSDAGERARMGARGREVCARFAADQVISRWEELLVSELA